MSYSDSKGPQTFGPSYYVKAAFAGGLCCSATHGAVTPMDVIVSEKGVAVLATGLGATVSGYFVQGWFKFGGVEFFKINIAQSLGEKKAWENRTAIYLASAAMAEFIADLFLCPLEAVRIRSLADKTFPKGLGPGISRMLATDGFLGFYAGLGPILFKQIPYTMAKFSVQGKAAETMYSSTNSSPETLSPSANVKVSLASGVIAGIVAAIVSQPADNLLSKINEKGAGGTGSTSQRLLNIARETGAVKLATNGLAARCVMVGTLTAGQFGVFDTVMNLVGAEKFHFKRVD